MSAFKNALHITSAEAGDRLSLAKDLLDSGEEVVVVDGVVALSRIGKDLVAEVIASKLPGDFALQVQAAKALLGSSTLSVTPQDWVVVEDYGTGTLDLWRAS